MNPLSHMYRSVYTEPVRAHVFLPLLSPVDIEHLNVFPSAQRGVSLALTYLLLFSPVSASRVACCRVLACSYVNSVVNVDVRWDRFELDFTGSYFEEERAVMCQGRSVLDKNAKCMATCVSFVHKTRRQRRKAGKHKIGEGENGKQSMVGASDGPYCVVRRGCDGSAYIADKGVFCSFSVSG